MSFLITAATRGEIKDALEWKDEATEHSGEDGGAARKSDSAFEQNSIGNGRVSNAESDLDGHGGDDIGHDATQRRKREKVRD